MPWEDAVEEAYERKSLKYTELAADVGQRGWKAKVCPVEDGCRGFVGKSTILPMKDLLRVAEQASHWLWMKRKAHTWAAKQQG